MSKIEFLKCKNRNIEIEISKDDEFINIQCDKEDINREYEKNEYSIEQIKSELVKEFDEIDLYANFIYDISHIIGKELTEDLKDNLLKLINKELNKEFEYFEELIEEGCYSDIENPDYMCPVCGFRLIVEDNKIIDIDTDLDN